MGDGDGVDDERGTGLFCVEDTVNGDMGGFVFIIGTAAAAEYDDAAIAVADGDEEDDDDAAAIAAAGDGDGDEDVFILGGVLEGDR